MPYLNKWVSFVIAQPIPINSADLDILVIGVIQSKTELYPSSTDIKTDLIAHNSDFPYVITYDISK